MVMLPPPPDDIVHKIWKAWEVNRKSYVSKSLGVSQLGDDCERRVWLKFRWFKQEEHAGRMLRLFHTGELEEERIIDDLEAIGIEVHDRDENGNQYVVEFHSGHLRGKLDGAALNVPEAPKSWHVLEFKTHNDKSFKDVVKNGVKKSKYSHFIQMQVYMGLTGMSRALYVAKNKNDDDLYAERVPFDKELFESCMRKAERIIFGSMPDRINDHPSFFVCKSCFLSDICHNGESFDRNCRTCVNSKVLKNGFWQCGLDKEILNIDKQRIGCGKYDPIKIVSKRSD